MPNSPARCARSREASPFPGGPAIETVPAARRLSRRSAAVATTGAAAAGLLTALVPRPLAGDLTLQPVYLAGLLAQLDGIRIARLVLLLWAAARSTS